MAVQNGMANVVACIFADTAATGGRKIRRRGRRRGHLGGVGHARQRRQQRARLPPPHGALWLDQRAARLDLGDLPQARAAQSQRRDEEADDARGSPELAHDRRSAAHVRLLPDLRWRGLHPRHLARACQGLQEEAGVDPRHGPGPHDRKPARAGMVVPAAPGALHRGCLQDGRRRPERHRRGAVLRQFHRGGAVLARARAVLQEGRGRRPMSRAARASRLAATACRSTPLAEICRSPTCRAGCTWSRACARSAASAARDRSRMPKSASSPAAA